MAAPTPPKKPEDMTHEQRIEAAFEYGVMAAQALLKHPHEIHGTQRAQLLTVAGGFRLFGYTFRLADPSDEKAIMDEGEIGAAFVDGFQAAYAAAHKEKIEDEEEAYTPTDEPTRNPKDDSGLPPMYK